jgi:hypothetical protein
MWVAHSALRIVSGMPRTTLMYKIQNTGFRFGRRFDAGMM